MDSSGRPQTVTLKSPYGRYDEARAAGAIKCGHLLKIDANGELLVHATAVGNAERMFATEDVHLLEGKTIDDDYADDDLVSYRLYLPGDEVQGWIKDGEVIVIGDHLVSAGDGSLKKVVTAATDCIIAVAIEARSPSGANLRSKFRIM